MIVWPSASPSGVVARQQSIGAIADKLRANRPLSDEERLLLADALADIRAGKRADEAFGLRAKRGEKRSLRTHERNAELDRALAMTWIATAIMPEPHGFGWTLTKACEQAEATGFFSFTCETMQTYWKQDLSRNASLRDGMLWNPKEPDTDLIP